MNKVFISYRRAGGAEIARLVAQALQQRGHETVLDVDSLGGGPFPDSIRREIRNADAVVVVLTEHALDRVAVATRDWFLEEIGEAVGSGMRLVPLWTRGFEWPAAPHTPEIAALLHANGVAFSHDYFEASMDRLDRLLRSELRGRSSSRRLPILALAAALMATVLLVRPWSTAVRLRPYFTLSDRGSSATAQPTTGVAEIEVAGGRVRFRSDRFRLLELGEVDRDGAALHSLNRASRTTADLRFSIDNETDYPVILDAVRALRLGMVVVSEDRSAPEMVALGEAHADAKMGLSPERTDLGRVTVTMDDMLRGTESHSLESDLLGAKYVETIDPRSTRWFRLRASCEGEQAQRILITKPVRVVGWANRDGWESAETEAEPLKSLRDPEPSDALHVLGIAVDVTVDGTKGQLFSDWLYVLAPRIHPQEFSLIGDHELPLAEVFGGPQEAVARMLLQKGVKTHRETLAYRLATEANARPENADPDAVSPWCYAGDAESPLRKPGSLAKPAIVAGAPLPEPAESAKPSLEWASLTKDGVPTHRTARSNIVDVLANIERSYPVVGAALRTEIETLARVPDEPLGRKAAFVAAQLQRRNDDGSAGAPSERE